MVKEVRWRYIVFHLHSPLSPKVEELDSVLRKHIKSFLGSYGLSKNPFKLIMYDEKSKLGILRCPHKSLEVIRLALALLHSIGGMPSAIHVAKVSGTLKKARSITLELAEKLKSYWEELEAGMKKPSQATET
ncbi:MAG: Rpp14/Pop5 family protein [Candidatus Nezhaarchaeota archaeon]|nr:Rpp14/Pop5 family protein [Candidatus Nezhaarchaeota archaeon]